MFIKEIILACYIICIAGIVAGLTCGILSNMHKRSSLNRAVVAFLTGMLVICFYDVGIYYFNYVVGQFSSMEIMRIGNCLIAVAMFMWLGLQGQIIDRDALRPFDNMVRKYLIVYAAVWFAITVLLPVEYFYTVKWLLLITDVILIICFVSAAVAHIVYASVTRDNDSMIYMLITTGLLVWNYISYFWGETSVYWGNSRFIREPLDLTVVFWLIISILSAFFVYKKCFKPTFGGISGVISSETTVEPIHVDLNDRIRELAEEYRLTPREREITELVYHGKGNREIAEELFLSESTVKTHIYNIFRKLEVKSRVEVIYVINEEFLDTAPAEDEAEQ